MTVVKEEDPELERPLDAEDAGEAGAGSASSDEEDDVDDEDQETETDSDGGDNGNVGNAPTMKKGPWTPEEDKRLKEYVEAHGEGNWNRLQRNAGLNRCGKSCRLRWANHLRPDLKKGPFEEDEIDKILEFHIKWGNKWAKMASKLPGRTDNEIKNFWNTRLKRHTKAGMPIYPEHLVSRVTDQNMNWHTPEETHGKKRSNESSHEKVIGMHDLIDEVMTFQYLDYGKDPVVPTKPLKRHASTGNLKNFYSIDLNNVSIKSQSVPLGSAIASGYPVHGNSGTIMKTELHSFQSSDLSYLPSSELTVMNTELPSFQSSDLSLFQSTELPSFQTYVLDPLAYDAVSLNAYPMSHDSEIQASNLPSWMHGTSLEASLLNTSLEANFFNDDPLHLKNHFGEDDGLLPLRNLCQSFDSSACKNGGQPFYSSACKNGGQPFYSSAWEGIASDRYKFPSPSSPGSENNE